MKDIHRNRRFLLIIYLKFHALLKSSGLENPTLRMKWWSGSWWTPWRRGPCGPGWFHRPASRDPDSTCHVTLLSISWLQKKWQKRYLNFKNVLFPTWERHATYTKGLNCSWYRQMNKTKNQTGITLNLKRHLKKLIWILVFQ